MVCVYRGTGVSEIRFFDIDILWHICLIIFNMSHNRFHSLVYMEKPLEEMLKHISLLCMVWALGQARL